MAINSQLIILFGISGAGKTYTGKLLRDKFGFFFYEGDNDCTEDVREAIINAQTITDPMKQKYLEEVVASVRKLQKVHNKLVVAVALLKNWEYELFRKNFPEAKMVSVESTANIIEQRVCQRVEHIVNSEFLKTQFTRYQAPQIDHERIENTTDKEAIIYQLNTILNKDKI